MQKLVENMDMLWDKLLLLNQPKMISKYNLNQN